MYDYHIGVINFFLHVLEFRCIKEFLKIQRYDTCNASLPFEASSIIFSHPSKSLFITCRIGRSTNHDQFESTLFFTALIYHCNYMYNREETQIRTFCILYPALIHPVLSFSFDCNPFCIAPRFRFRFVSVWRY